MNQVPGHLQKLAPTGAGRAPLDRTAVEEVTIGVAIAVPQPYAAELERWRSEFGDPLAGSIPAHITLLPPTPVPLSCMDSVAAHLRATARDETPFEVRLRGTATFRPVSPVVFVALAEGIAQCGQLEQRVRSGPLERELQFSYHPHVTVAHDVDEAALETALCTLDRYQARFRADGFNLYEHGSDGLWRSRHRFDFGAATS